MTDSYRIGTPMDRETAQKAEASQRAKLAAFERASVEVALNAIAALVGDYMGSTHPARYFKAGRYCKIAGDLKEMIAGRVAEFDDGAIEFENGGLQPLRRFRQPGVGDGQADLVREMLAAFQKFSTDQVKNREAGAGRDDAGELGELLCLPEDAQKRLRARIEQLTARISKRAKEESDELVHPDVLRGHQARGEGQDDASSSVAADGRGAPSPGEAPEDRGGPEEPMGGEGGVRPSGRGLQAGGDD